MEREVGRRGGRDVISFLSWLIFWNLEFSVALDFGMSGCLDVVCETHLDMLVEVSEEIRKYVQFGDLILKDNVKIRANTKDKKYERGSKNERNVSEE